MSELTLHHFHDPDGEHGAHGPPPACCVERFSKVARQQHKHAEWRQEEAVHAERRRVILDAVDVITTYGRNIATVLEGSDAKLAEIVTRHSADAIRATGCVCPRFDIETFGGSRQIMPGLDPRCGMHGEPR